MNDRLALGVAAGAGYVLGRTKKAKLAFGIGTVVIAKKLHIGPRALAQFASSPLRNHPQFKEIADQLREDMRGVGKAAASAIVTRRIHAVADRLHDRTLDVRERLSGGVADEDDEPLEDDEPREHDDREKTTGAARKTGGTGGAAKKAPAKRTTAAKKTAAKKTTPAKKTTAKKTTARKTTARKTAAKKSTAAAKGGRSRG